MKEPNAYPGSFGGGVKPIGFARHAQPRSYGSIMSSGYGRFMRTEGFAQYVVEGADVIEDEKPRRSVPRAKRYNASQQRPETYEWPDMVVSSLIDKSQAGSGWRNFDRTLDARARQIGRSVGLRNFQCVIIPGKELHRAMDEKYTSAARDSNEKRRLRLVNKTREDINGIIEDLAREEQLESSASKKSASLWVPGKANIGMQEGYGAYGIGVMLEDEVGLFAQRKHSLVARICSELGFNPVHFTPLEEPMVLMVYTSPVPTDGLNFTFPPTPYDIPLRSTRAYGPDQQVAKLSVMV